MKTLSEQLANVTAPQRKGNQSPKSTSSLQSFKEEARATLLTDSSKISLIINDFYFKRLESDDGGPKLLAALNSLKNNLPGKTPEEQMKLIKQALRSSNPKF